MLAGDELQKGGLLTIFSSSYSVSLTGRGLSALIRMGYHLVDEDCFSKLHKDERAKGLNTSNLSLLA